MANKKTQFKWSCSGKDKTVPDCTNYRFKKFGESRHVARSKMGWTIRGVKWGIGLGKGFPVQWG